MPHPSEKPKRLDAGNHKFAAGQWLSMGRLAGSGMELGLTVAALTVLGWWLDTQWNTSPWMLVTGAFIGTVGSIYKLWRIQAKWYGNNQLGDKQYGNDSDRDRQSRQTSTGRDKDDDHR